MNHEEPYRNQAERLRQKIEKIKDGEVEVTNNGLPSRTDIHRNKKNKTKWKVKFPIIRLLALFFILLPIVIISAYSTLGDKNINPIESVSSKNIEGYEEINYEENNGPVQENNSSSKDLVEEEEEVVDEVEPATEEIKETSEDAEITKQTEENEKNNVSNEVSSDNNQESNSNDSIDSAQNIVYHTVQSNETLFRIAMKYYQSQEGIEIIQKANQLQGNEIQVGQVLKIPK